MNPQQLNQKYSDLLDNLYLEAARGNILTYHEFIARFRALDSQYLSEAEAAGSNEPSIDTLFVENALAAQSRGETLRDYAYRVASVINDLTVDIRIDDPDDEDDNIGD